MIAFQQNPAMPAAAAPAPAYLETDPVRLMAQAMRELAFNGRTVDREALMQRGFTRAQISTHWEAACDLANEECVRRVA